MAKRIQLSTIALATIGVLISYSVQAFNPTPAQIQQFQALPKSQQEMLAKQYGVDISVLTGSPSASKQEKKPTTPPERVNSYEERSISSEVPREVKELQAFGYDVFSGKPTSFTPIDDLPVPNDYVVAPGDEIKVQVYGKESSQHSLVINREGVINYPQLGPINVAGQTFSQLRDSLIKTIKQKIIGIDVDVSMGSMRTMQIYIVGEMAQPGAYNVNGLTTVTQALIAAGGIQESGSLRKVQLKRNGRLIKEVDMYQLLLKGDTQSDLRLLPGDTLFVPTKGAEVIIDGAVKRSAIYELKGTSTLGQLVANAGGTDADAYLQQVTVRRLTDKGVVIKSVDLSTQAGHNFIIKDGDEIRVNQRSNLISNAVAVRGSVVRQGAYQFVPGMKISDVITSVNTDLMPNADLNYALVVREIGVNREIKVLQFNLGTAITRNSSKDNLTLEKGDQLFVFNNGFDQEYWLGDKANSAKELKKEQETQQAQMEKLRLEHGNSVVDERERYDNATGALVEETNEVSKLKLGQLEDVATTELVRRNSREKLLAPLIERLKAQASLGKAVQIVEVTGAVKYPGIYPLVDNGDIQDLIVAAGGLVESAHITVAELTRAGFDGGKLRLNHKNISLDNILNDKEGANLSLVSKDRLHVFTKPQWRDEQKVELQGEVVFPGTYTFQRGETIDDVIQRAGGLTEFAYPKGAVFSRVKLRLQEEQRLKMLNMQLKQEIASLALRRQTSSASYASSPVEAMDVADELASAQALGRMVLNLPEILKGNDKADLMLENGDKLYIPSLNKVISVMGEVQFASSHIFSDSMTVEDYINSAGGTKKQADTDRVYVIRADGSVMLPNNSFWFSRNSKPLEPGDTIIVPIDTDYLDGLSALTSATQILYQIGIAWSAVKD
ncbi:SLBB domain-containing protein [Vibrio sp. Of7-15]|uniref:SLBB domain-containing protein n=1 Tax=Vibrio sp. Of7-15 TaxID=2724879 RepID=UPI001EF2ECDA|nr:SLBB domain-containing protein [Vibrio sp. Of7-15]MCG7496837.1 SLBB domain-containing protein [Vibrio sp. Of7-15]